jgi:hypothetical protein
MSRYYEAIVTLTIDGDERDCAVRGFVLLEYGLGMGGSLGAQMDGDIEIMIGGEWCPVDSVNLDAGDEERSKDALCEVALEDDSHMCDECERAERAYEAAE